MDQNNLVSGNIHFQYIILNFDSFEGFMNNTNRKFTLRYFGERNYDKLVGDKFNHDVYGFIIINGIAGKQLDCFPEDELSG